MSVRWYCIAVEESSFLLSVLGWHLLIRPYRFQVNISMTYDLYIALWSIIQSQILLKQLDNAMPLSKLADESDGPQPPPYHGLWGLAWCVPTYLSHWHHYVLTLPSAWLLHSHRLLRENILFPSRIFACNTLPPDLAMADIFPSSQGLHSQEGLS